MLRISAHKGSVNSLRGAVYRGFLIFCLVLCGIYGASGAAKACICIIWRFQALGGYRLEGLGWVRLGYSTYDHTKSKARYITLFHFSTTSEMQCCNSRVNACFYRETLTTRHMFICRHLIYLPLDNSHFHKHSIALSHIPKTCSPIPARCECRSSNSRYNPIPARPRCCRKVS